MKTQCANCGFVDEGKYCSNCGLPLEQSQHESSSNPLSTIAGILGFFGILRVLSTAHTPISGIKSLLNADRLLLKQTIVAYIELVTIIPLLHKELILRLGNAVNYPIIFQGPIVENKIIFNLASAIGGLLGLSIIYLLPKYFLEHHLKSKLLMVNLQFAMYSVFYLTVGDVLKFSLWHYTESQNLMMIIGSIILLTVTILQVYIWRKQLHIKWITIVLLSVIGGFTAVRLTMQQSQGVM